MIAFFKSTPLVCSKALCSRSWQLQSQRMSWGGSATVGRRGIRGDFQEKVLDWSTCWLPILALWVVISADPWGAIAAPTKMPTKGRNATEVGVGSGFTFYDCCVRKKEGPYCISQKLNAKINLTMSRFFWEALGRYYCYFLCISTMH